MAYYTDIQYTLRRPAPSMQDMSPRRIPDPSRSIDREMHGSRCMAACIFGHSCIAVQCSACMQARRRCWTPYGPVHSTPAARLLLLLISRLAFIRARPFLPSLQEVLMANSRKKNRSINGVYGRHDDMFGRRRRCMICMRICCMERIDRRPAPSSCSRGGGLRAARACSIVYRPRPSSQQSSEALFKCVWYESFSSGACRQARQGKAAGRQAARQHPTHTQQAMDDPAGQRNYYSPDRSIGCACA